MPSQKTLDKVYDHLDFTHAFDAFVNTMQGVNFHAIHKLLRLYGALEPFFDKTWQPGEIEPVS